MYEALNQVRLKEYGCLGNVQAHLILRGELPHILHLLWVVIGHCVVSVLSLCVLIAHLEAVFYVGLVFTPRPHKCSSVTSLGLLQNCIAIKLSSATLMYLSLVYQKRKQTGTKY